MNQSLKSTQYLDNRLSRRLKEDRQNIINAEKMVQAIDLSLALEADDIAPTKGLPGYFTYGWRLACDEIIHLSNLGVKKIALRFVSSVSSNDSIESSLERFEKVLINVLDKIKDRNIQLVIDPFGLALTPDGQWGVRNSEGQFDIKATLALLTDVGRRVSNLNVYGLVTLGRIPEEVQATKKGITEGGGKTKIFSFSQNSETSTAYVYLDSAGHDTGQKILPGNVDEMNLWSLLDIWHGTDVSIIKPMESFHLMDSLSYILDNDKVREDFLRSKNVQELAESKDFVKDSLNEMLQNLEQLKSKCEKIKLGGYTVSGSTYMLALLADAKGEAMARARIEEVWVTALAAMGERCDCLIDRNTKKFLEGSILH